MSKVKGKKSKALLRLCERENWTCWICGGEVPMFFDILAPDAPSRDHVIPRVRLKKMLPSSKLLETNIKLAHRWCNSHRGDRAVKSAEAEMYATRLQEVVEEYLLELEAKQ